MQRETALRGLAAFGLSTFAIGCNLALGIDPAEYEDVAVQLCSCPQIDFAFSDCTTRVHDALENASPEERDGWLSTFEAQGCATCNEQTTAVCLQTAPVCRPTGASCSAFLDCCGTLDRSGYCYDGKCRADAPTCKHSFEACNTDDECCGSEVGLAACFPSDNGDKLCLEGCASSDKQENCWGCCTAVEDNGEVRAICIDGPAAASYLESITAGTTSCESGCILGVEEGCPEGTGTICQRVPTTDPPDGMSFLHYCLPPGAG